MKEILYAVQVAKAPSNLLVRYILETAHSSMKTETVFLHGIFLLCSLMAKIPLLQPFLSEVDPRSTQTTLLYIERTEMDGPLLFGRYRTIMWNIGILPDMALYA